MIHGLTFPQATLCPMYANQWRRQLRKRGQSELVFEFFRPTSIRHSDPVNRSHEAELSTAARAMLSVSILLSCE